MRADMPWPVRILYMVLFNIIVSIFAADRGRPSLLQLIIACGGTRLAYAPLASLSKLAAIFFVCQIISWLSTLLRATAVPRWPGYALCAGI